VLSVGLSRFFLQSLLKSLYQSALPKHVKFKLLLRFNVVILKKKPEIRATCAKHSYYEQKNERKFAK